MRQDYARTDALIVVNFATRPNTKHMGMIMQHPRIIIITHCWPPRNAIGTHRPYSWAKYWTAAGAEVQVLTTCKYHFDEPLDLLMPPLDGVRVFEIEYQGGSRQMIDGLSRRRSYALLKSLYRFLQSRSMAPTVNPRTQWPQAARNQAIRLAESSDIVISTYDPVECHLIACQMKQSNPRLRWIADYRDLWSRNHMVSRSLIRQRKTELLELSTVGGFADEITTVSTGLADVMSAFIDKPVTVITNGYDIEDHQVIQNLEHTRVLETGILRIVHTGMLYRGRRDPEPLLKSLVRLSRRNELGGHKVVVEFYGRNIDVARSLVKRKEYAPFIRIIGHVPREQAISAQLSAHALLLLESGKADASGVLTGKIFEYIATGVPILSLGSNADSAIGQLLAKTRTGICLECDEESIDRALLQLTHGTSPEWFAPVVDEVLIYSRKQQAMKLLERINFLLKTT